VENEVSSDSDDDQPKRFMILIGGRWDVLFLNEPANADLTCAARIIEHADGAWTVTLNMGRETGQRFTSEADAYDFIVSPLG
jgi:hypothetical protein